MGQVFITASMLMAFILAYPTGAFAGKPDRTAPLVSITSPASGSSYTTAQTVTVTASALDNVGVSKVELYDNGALKGTDTSAPYSYAWSVTSANNGSHSWMAKAYDARGNNSTSGAVSLSVNIASADITPPTASITSPASGSSYSAAQTVTIAASASDNVGVSKVEFYDNGALKATGTSAPYSYAWSISSANNGSHSWTAKSYDVAGNTSTSGAISLSVNIASADTTPPTVSITSPASGSSYSAAQTVTINASASDNVGVSKVEFYDNGTLKATGTSAPYSYAWSISSANNGTHSWTAKAYDAAGNASTSGAVSLSVNIASADITPPTASITSPASGSSYSAAQTVTIAASASDNVGVSKVEFYDNGALKATGTSAPYSYAWSISSANNGSHSWTAKAYDAAGNVGTSSVVSLTVNIASVSGGGATLWSQAFGGTGTDRGTGIAADGVGDVVITGYYANAVDFGGGVLPCTSTRSLVVAKYDVNGSPLWSRCVAKGTGYVTPNAVAMDASGNVVVTGQFSGTAAFGTHSLTSAGGNDAFVVKYSASGDILWVRQAGGVYDETGNGVATDGSGNIVITGMYTIPSVIFVSKYSPDGTLLWSKQFTGQGNNIGRAVAVDGQGEVLVTGEFYGTIQLAGTTLTLTSTTSYYPDVLLAKFDAAGNALWAKNVGGEGEEHGYGIAVDQATGESAITGTFYGTSDFGQGPVTATSYDIFLAKYDAAGNVEWSKTFTGAGNDAGYAVAIDPQSGDVLMTAAFEYSKNFGGQTFTSHGGTDIVIARYAGATGTHVWSKAYGGPSADVATALAADDAGHLYATGVFYGQIDLGDGALSDPAYGGIFLVQLTP